MPLLHAADNTKLMFQFDKNHSLYCNNQSPAKLYLISFKVSETVPQRDKGNKAKTNSSL